MKRRQRKKREGRENRAVMRDCKNVNGEHSVWSMMAVYGESDVISMRALRATIASYERSRKNGGTE